MSSKVLFDAAVAPNATQYYGSLIVSNIRYEDGPVNIEQFLGISLRSPASISSQDFSTSPDPWIEFLPDVTNEQVDASTFHAVARLSVSEPYTIGRLTINIGVNGDLTQSPERFVESIAIAVDAIPE
ncbi:hypothetical protein V495_05505 [Pseudogymnoascus sp. VKM F-4514 (FW-929)]|nr:hypothetical protein V490_06135 [Pseudogymnoascus sp. VKM F-3557]KFY40281.1 hypothetical protein V495_05505 [Pseudogymnoascus sp. VKM F-4514 (FW-929)]KFY57728.1 hypothetical protein V497_05304 [Pseudogymnoascus sp. VKM F-4516 (FW-969)]